jgi:hypothetical protein
MLAFLLCLFRLVWLLGKSHHGIVLENLALRQQLAIYKRKQMRPRLLRRDLWFWIALSVVLGWLATCLVRRPSRHGGAVAAGAFSPVLGEPLEEVIYGETGSTARQPSGPYVDSNFWPKQIRCGVRRAFTASC